MALTSGLNTAYCKYRFPLFLLVLLTLSFLSSPQVSTWTQSTVTLLWMAFTSGLDTAYCAISGDLKHAHNIYCTELG